MALRLLDFGLEIGDGLWAIDVDLWSVSGGNGEKGGIYLKDLLLGGLYGNLHGGGEEKRKGRLRGLEHCAYASSLAPPPMQTQAGENYLRQLATYIRRNGQALAEAGLFRRRKPEPLSPYPFLPLGWLSPSLSPLPPKPLLLAIDTHHLFYILMRLEALGIQAGPLDVQVEPPSRPTSYANFYAGQTDPETLSLASFRSSLSIVSNLSLPTSWWSRQEPLTIDAELKFIYSSFTKLPALAISAPGKKVIAELVGESLDRNAIPLDVFKNLQRLECENIDPRILLGWDLLSISLRSVKIRKSGLQDISQLFIGAVLDDRARRQGTSSQKRQRDTSLQPTPGSPGEPPPSGQLPSASWAFLKHLYLPDNNLTLFPAELLPYLTSVTHLDLSSNLFVSVPSGLEELYSLTSLNLADNIIDSVLGIYLNLGQLLHLNLSHNRLESLCGLERLLALERVDLRHNLLEESSEIGRLVVLPNISELWIEGNPFVEIEESYRINCFDYFWKEDKTIILDGTPPTMYERRSLGISEHAKSILPPSSSSAPVIAIEPSYDQVFAAPPHLRHNAELSSKESPQTPSDTASLVTGGRRQKKIKRIVDLDGNFASAPHSRLGSIQPTTSVVLPLDDPAEVLPPSKRSRHGRYQTEHIPPSENIYPSNKSDTRRARQSASAFEGSSEDERDVDKYRRTIESLKKDMGDGWLKVYNQTQAS